MKRNILILIIVISVVIIILIIKLTAFRMFDIERTELVKIPVKGGNYNIEITFVQAGATTQDVIQVKKVFKEGKVEILNNFKKYNCLINHKLINDTMVQVVLNDTGYFVNKPDTFNIVVK